MHLPIRVLHGHDPPPRPVCGQGNIRHFQQFTFTSITGGQCRHPAPHSISDKTCNLTASPSTTSGRCVRRIASFWESLLEPEHVRVRFTLCPAFTCLHVSLTKVSSIERREDFIASIVFPRGPLLPPEHCSSAAFEHIGVE